VTAARVGKDMHGVRGKLTGRDFNADHLGAMAASGPL
jgi:hypothetical protein